MILYIMLALFRFALLGVRSYAERRDCLPEGTKIPAPDITEGLLLRPFTNKRVLTSAEILVQWDFVLNYNPT
jgi:hypothetical protein